MFWKRLYPTEWVALGAALGLVGVMVAPIFKRAHEFNGSQRSCTSNLRQIVLALEQYSQDANGFLPSLQGKGGNYGWADALVPYLGSTAVFQCPSETSTVQSSPQYRGYCDYWFNGRLSGRRDNSLSDPSVLLAFGEGNDGTDKANARYSLVGIPSRWLGNTNSPLYRHFKTANYAFADGHVKALKPALIDIDNPKWANGPKLRRSR